MSEIRNMFVSINKRLDDQDYKISRFSENSRPTRFQDQQQRSPPPPYYSPRDRDPRNIPPSRSVQFEGKGERNQQHLKIADGPAKYTLDNYKDYDRNFAMNDYDDIED
jgi:hypothetical protein